MVRASFPLGRFMGVDVRLHLALPLLLILFVLYGAAATGNATRGFGLFAALLFAVLVREITRAVAAAYAGLKLRVLFLLPIGGVMGFTSDATGSMTAVATAPGLLWSGPLANILVGLLLLGLSYGCAPSVDLLHQPWISPSHVLRSFVWMQFAIAAINLLPTATMPTRQGFRIGKSAFSGDGAAPEATAPASGVAAFSLISGLAVAMLLAGIVTANLWLLILGGFVLLYAQVRSQVAAGTATAGAAATGAPAGVGGDPILVEEVMSSDYTTLSTSDTIRGALERTAATFQEVFPVLRGDRLVGSVSRHTLVGHLQQEGDNYIQGLMTRSLRAAYRGEALGKALERAASQGSTECVPVLDGDGESDRVLGLLTPGGVARAAGQVRLTRLPANVRRARS